MASMLVADYQSTSLRECSAGSYYLILYGHSHYKSNNYSAGRRYSNRRGRAGKSDLETTKTSEEDRN